MTTTSHIGKRLYVATALPATNNETGFDALTWVEVKGVQVLPQLGVSHANIDVPDLASGFTQGVKGASTGNDSTMTVRRVAADTGQGNVRTLANSGGLSGVGSIKIAKASGALTDGVPALQVGDAVQYAQGYFHSYVEIQGDTTTHEGFSVNFKQNAETVDALEDA